MSALEVLAGGPLATIQDEGRPGLAALGVGVSGAADLRSMRLANRLVGNDSDAATIEVTLGGLSVRARGTLLVTLTGAPCPATIDGRPVGMNAPIALPRGATLHLDLPERGLRTYLAVRGGIAVESALGSRSTDVLSGIGPPALAPGMVLPVGPPPSSWSDVDVAPVAPPAAGEVSLRIIPGPRHDWFHTSALDLLCSAPYEVSSQSNRIGMRLHGPVLERSIHKELPSEGVVQGALQVPPTGQPTLFLADHPVTGGYPVIAVVHSDDLNQAAQARPGQSLRLRLHRDQEL